ncbi:flagellar export chaperone FliS [Pigmentiphaga aceris]|uniref:Flagellar secretion chaperone FliS n=1 Tax=Pigmentiphaga aceris TaxID=1940612 RepID=A0A5C0B247_9BURK|nr:flagellar export chaperone FliS [Pigmentiphaga aceris]QEI07250.1 flagellar export chaperone FliS [Pigmentiphaga aceris]
MQGFGSFGARAYASVGVETKVTSSNPHALVLMLFDGALDSVQRALVCLEEKDIPGKAKAIVRADRIISEGLRASLDPSTGGQLAERLEALYDYMSRRLVVANAGNDPDALLEVQKLLRELRGAWAEISPTAQAA